MRAVIDRLARRAVIYSGGTRLRALADIRAAVEASIQAEIDVGDRGGATDAEVLLERVMGGALPRLTWRQIGEDLGVSAQAAHRKYGPRSRVDARLIDHDGAASS